MDRSIYTSNLYRKLSKNNNESKLKIMLDKLVKRGIDNYISPYKIGAINLIYNSCVIKQGKIFLIYLEEYNIDNTNLMKHKIYCNENSIKLLILNKEMTEKEMEEKLWLFLDILNYTPADQ